MRGLITRIKDGSGFGIDGRAVEDSGVRARCLRGETHHAEVQVLLDPLLAVLELLVQTHDVEGVQRIHDGGP